MSIIRINTDPSLKQLNQFGFIWLGFMVFFGAVARFKLDAATASSVLWVLAVVVPVIGWLAPAFMRAVFVGMSYAAWPIGFVVSHVVLAVVYYLVLTPIGLVMKLVGYDSMARRVDPGASSYWSKRATDRDGAQRYFRQF